MVHSPQNLDELRKGRIIMEELAHDGLREAVIELVSNIKMYDVEPERYISKVIEENIMKPVDAYREVALSFDAAGNITERNRYIRKAIAYGDLSMLGMLDDDEAYRLMIARGISSFDSENLLEICKQCQEGLELERLISDELHRRIRHKMRSGKCDATDLGLMIKLVSYQHMRGSSLLHTSIGLAEDMLKWAPDSDILQCTPGFFMMSRIIHDRDLANRINMLGALNGNESCVRAVIDGSGLIRDGEVDIAEAISRYPEFKEELVYRALFMNYRVNKSIRIALTEEAASKGYSADWNLNNLLQGDLESKDKLFHYQMRKGDKPSSITVSFYDREHGFRDGDCVALALYRSFHENRPLPDYVTD